VLAGHVKALLTFLLLLLLPDAHMLGSKTICEHPPAHKLASRFGLMLCVATALYRWPLYVLHMDSLHRVHICARVACAAAFV
jgi:hypothetical protein